ncbi:MAG: hypothetical protein KIT31_13640 [Deltaproteobacteria bacterium]|nr:hypothetical protein [Deltaproteobacteria bacterium]
MRGGPALAIAILAACGDNAVGIPYAEYDDLVASARCERLVRCGLFAERATCDGFFRARPDRGLAASINVGKVLFNGVAAEACQAALAAQSCDAASRDARVLPAPCRKMFLGTLPVDAECQRDEECVSGSCDQEAACPTNTCCPGVCTSSERAPIGDACTSNATCADDAFCGPDNLCRALATIGEECRRDEECDYGLGCIGPTDQMPGRCRETPGFGGTCLYGRCGEIGAACKAFACVALGLPGAACISNADCSPFTLCDGATQKCVDVPALGMPCTVACAGEAYCEPSTMTCTAPLANTTPCRADDQCASLFCEEGPIFDACATRTLCF